MCPCGAPSRPYHPYCRECFNAYQRKNRQKYKDFSADTKKRAIVRSMANVYKRRGKLGQPSLCEVCVLVPPEITHHIGHSDPLNVRWLCRGCHIKILRWEKLKFRENLRVSS